MQINPWKIGLQSARANFVPGLILQMAAGLLIVSFHFVPTVRATLMVVADWQARFGIAFSGISFLIFCGIIPPLICLLVPTLRPRAPWKSFFFAITFWSLMGIVVALFYRLQNFFFGDGHDLVTLLAKVIVDQFVFSAFLTVPFLALVHVWKEKNYRWSEFKPLLRKGWYKRLVLPTLIINWIIWFPSLFVIYSMPTLLQPHIGGLISGFWSLMCLQIAARNQ